MREPRAALLVKLVDADPAARSLVRLQRDADALLDDRSRLVHSVAMWDVSDAVPAAVCWHPRSDTEATITAGQVREHAHDLGAVAARAVQAPNCVREQFRTDPGITGRVSARHIEPSRPLTCSRARARGRNVASVVVVVRVARVLVILVLALMAISFVMRIGTASTGALEKVVLLALAAGCVYASAKVSDVTKWAVQRVEKRSSGLGAVGSCHSRGARSTADMIAR